jgi:type IV fimbrial biogenesis protein FimT
MTMKQTGLTLIELIVTLAVISILLVVGIPQFKSTTANSRLTSAINTLSGDLAFARTEAIKRGVSVDVTAPTTDWADGWTTAVIISGSPTQNLRLSPALTANTAINTSGVASVQFTADGRSNAAVTFSLCDDRVGAFGKTLSLTTAGQNFLAVKQTCP